MIKPPPKITSATVRADFNDPLAVVHYAKAAHRLGHALLTRRRPRLDTQISGVRHRAVPGDPVRGTHRGPSPRHYPAGFRCACPDTTGLGPGRGGALRSVSSSVIPVTGTGARPGLYAVPGTLAFPLAPDQGLTDVPVGISVVQLVDVINGGGTVALYLD